MQKNLVLLIVVLVIGLGALWYLNSLNQGESATPAPTVPQASETMTADDDAAEEAAAVETVTTTPPPTTPPATPPPATPPVSETPETGADVDETLSDLDSLFDESYDDSDLDASFEDNLDQSYGF